MTDRSSRRVKFRWHPDGRGATEATSSGPAVRRAHLSARIARQAGAAFQHGETDEAHGNEPRRRRKPDVLADDLGVKFVGQSMRDKTRFNANEFTVYRKALPQPARGDMRDRQDTSIPLPRVIHSEGYLSDQII